MRPSASRHDTVITVMAHTDMPAYSVVLADATRILQSGGRLVQIGVHPFFCGQAGSPAAATVPPG